MSSSREELRRAWLLADPADRPLLATRLREARGSDDDHFYGAFAGGGSGGGGGRAAPKSTAQTKSAGKTLSDAEYNKRVTAGAARLGKTSPQAAANYTKAAADARKGMAKPATPKLREPSESEWAHERTRFDAAWDKTRDQDKMGQVILRRANTITNPQKLFNLTRVLEDENYHTLNTEVQAIFEKKFGSYNAAVSAASRKLYGSAGGAAYSGDVIKGSYVKEARGSDDDHFYGAYAGGGAGKGGGRAAPASAAQTKSAGLGNAKTKKELRTGDVSKMTAADRAKAHVQDKADAEYRAKNLAIPGQLAAAKEFQFKAKTTAMGGGSYKFQGETFNVSGVHPRGHVQSLRKMAQKAMSSGNDARAKKATDLMLVLNKKFGLGYPVPR